MKHLTIVLLLLFAINGMSYAQEQAADTHPRATISALDYQTGNLVQMHDSQAIAFKNAFIYLVLGTRTGKQLYMQNAETPGEKRIVITQTDPQANGNAYELDLENTIQGQTSTVFSFIYNVDQNKLYFYDQGTQNYVPEIIEEENRNNLNNCAQFGRFNMQTTYNGNSGADADYTAPIDIDVSANVAPPALPDYEQPECPADGYLWQPGYWAYSRDSNNYYWVPGVWIAPPSQGVLWTPPYWAYERNVYVFHTGYWGSSIGFYGGINYGHGYQGTGFVGGEWHGAAFHYNTAVVRVNVVNVHNTYINKTVINNVTIINHNSFNGPGGVKATPSENEIKAMHQPHVNATPEQIKNQWAARNNKGQFASANNGGKPADLALVKAPVKVQPPNTGVKQMGNNHPPVGIKQGPAGKMGNIPTGLRGPAKLPADQKSADGKPVDTKPVTPEQPPGLMPVKGTDTAKHLPKGNIPVKPVKPAGPPGLMQAKGADTAKHLPKGNMPVKPVKPAGPTGLMPAKGNDTAKRLPKGNMPVKPAAKPAPGGLGLPGNATKPTTPAKTGNKAPGHNHKPVKPDTTKKVKTN